MQYQEPRCGSSSLPGQFYSTIQYILERSIVLHAASKSELFLSLLFFISYALLYDLGDLSERTFVVKIAALRFSRPAADLPTPTRQRLRIDRVPIEPWPFGMQLWASRVANIYKS